MNAIQSLENLATVNLNVTAVDTKPGTQWIMGSINVCFINKWINVYQIAEVCYHYIIICKLKGQRKRNKIIIALTT